MEVDRFALAAAAAEAAAQEARPVRVLKLPSMLTVLRSPPKRLRKPPHNRQRSPLPHLKPRQRRALQAPKGKQGGDAPQAGQTRAQPEAEASALGAVAAP